MKAAAPKAIIAGVTVLVKAFPSLMEASALAPTTTEVLAKAPCAL